jgi:hypothetical protein
VSVAKSRNREASGQVNDSGGGRAKFVNVVVRTYGDNAFAVNGNSFVKSSGRRRREYATGAQNE